MTSILDWNAMISCIQYIPFVAWYAFWQCLLRSIPFSFYNRCNKRSFHLINSHCISDNPGIYAANKLISFLLFFLQKLMGFLCCIRKKDCRKETWQKKNTRTQKSKHFSLAVYFYSSKIVPNSCIIFISNMCRLHCITSIKYTIDNDKFKRNEISFINNLMEQAQQWTIYFIT